MSLGSLFHKLVGSHGNDLTKGAQAAAHDTVIGGAITSAIAAARASGVPNAQKAIDATEAVAPVIVDLASKNGKTVLLDDAKTFARIAIETELANNKQTGPALIGALMLSLLGKGEAQ